LRAVGYGSSEAMEAACDAHVIWARASSQMRLIIGGLADGQKQVDIVSETKIDRFKVARIIKAMQREFMNAA
jgi:RNA polymerase sigma-70 factor, ECF subfamily